MDFAAQRVLMEIVTQKDRLHRLSQFGQGLVGQMLK